MCIGVKWYLADNIIGHLSFNHQPHKSYMHRFSPLRVFHLLILSVFIVILAPSQANCQFWTGWFDGKGDIPSEEDYDGKSISEADLNYLKYDGKPPSLELEKPVEEEEDDKDDKKKKSKRFYYGYRAKKGYAKSGTGKREKIFKFRYLKDYIEPDEFVPEVYWYSKSQKKIVNTKKIKPDDARILHGPYELEYGGEVREKGFFYIGTKHATWERFDGDYELVDREKFHKGWYAESEVTYYDAERKKLKEVIPIQWGEKEGQYYRFHENGLMAETGLYAAGQKTGTWREYWPLLRKSKKVIEWPEEPFYKDTVQGELIQEWDIKGEKVFEKEGWEAERRRKLNERSHR